MKNTDDLATLRWPLPIRTLVLLALALAVVPSSARAQPDDETPTLRVEGSAEVRMPPDIGVARLGVVEEAATARAAQQAANDTAAAIRDALLQVGIEARHLQTARLLLSPVYAGGPSQERDNDRIIAYRASNTLSVRVEDLDLMGAVIDAGLGAGSNRLEGVSFGLRDDQAAREDALRLAIGRARGEAEAMAEALDVELVSIRSVTEARAFVDQPMMEGARTLALQAASTPISPGEVTVRATVSIQYTIR